MYNFDERTAGNATELEPLRQFLVDKLAKYRGIDITTVWKS